MIKSKTKKYIKTILAGEYYVTNKKEIITTILGSCISVCLYDKINKVSGMNHFLLPINPSTSITNNEYTFNNSFYESDSLRYGAYSMELMMNDIIKKGGEKKFLQAKIFGGGNIISFSGTTETIGEKNITFILTYLRTEGIDIISKNVGGNIGRKIIYCTDTNAVFVKKIPISSIPKESITTIKSGSISFF